MSLISIHRSPSPTSEEGFPSDNESNEDVCRTANSSSIGLKSRSLSECYFIVRGAAVILSHSDQASVSPRSPSTHSTASPSTGQNDIEAHLQGMLRILRPADTLSMAVRLQSASLLGDNHVKYLAVLSTVDEETDVHEAALLGFDFLPDGKISVGVTVPIHSFSKVELDGDGGITVNSTNSSPYLFKPVSIQSMWSLFQCLHKELALACLAAKAPLFLGPTNYHWLNYYHSHITKDDLICAQWHHSPSDEAAQGDIRAELGSTGLQASTSSCLSSRRKEAEKQIHVHLKQIMQSVDLDAVTSKDIRNRLEEQLKVDSLSMYKEFIDREMLAILGQLDKPSKIYDYLYLGTEWNASNWEELKANKVEYILNVTKEVDNFFPSQFKYLKIWVSDEATTELLMHWQKTYDFIKEAKDHGSAVLVHCKKGISRSSSTVIAYIMKEYGWSLETSLNYVKDKRNCITPNHGFMEQLMTFHGVLSASSNRHSAFFNPTASSVDSLPNSFTNLEKGIQRMPPLGVYRQLSSSSQYTAEITSTTAGPFLPTLENTLTGRTKCDKHSLEEETLTTKGVEDVNLSRRNSSVISSTRTASLSSSTNTTARIEDIVLPSGESEIRGNQCAATLPNPQEASKSKSILLRYQPNNCKPKVARSIVRHKSTSTIASAKNFFGSKTSAYALTTDCSSKKRASSLADGITYSNKLGNGRVKQHKDNFENRLKNFKGKTQTATSFVSSIAKEISRLSISMSAGQTDNNFTNSKKSPIAKDSGSSIKHKTKAFNNKSISDINQQNKRNVKSLVNEFERGIISPAISDGDKLRATLNQESPLCKENLILERKICSFTAQVSLS